MQVSIFSEIDPLQSVLVHCPGNEQFYVYPDNLIEWIPGDNELVHNPDYLLFDDLIQPQIAMKEHEQLSQVIKHFIGNDNCIEFTTLLLDILHDKDLKKELLKDCLKLENLINKTEYPASSLLDLLSMDASDILHILLTGEKNDGNGGKIFQHPIPNLIFTRDIAAVIGQTVLITWGCRIARKRENILSKYIFNYHNIFQDIKTYDFYENFPNLSVEGGDIIILDANTICIGMSERTTPATINALLPLFFEEGFKRIYAIDLPKKRSIMHLDTIFNRISLDEVIIFSPILDQLNVYCISPGEKLEEGMKTTQNFLEILANDGIQLTPIICGGKEKKHQIREQWTDGANYFAISPGIILGYERNHHTINSLQHAGYKCIESTEFLKRPEIYKNKSKLMISIPSGELSRGRGGARCLTLPLRRSNN